jgi:hypothetical protein
MSTLTFEQQAARDGLTSSILKDVAYYVRYNDGDIPDDVVPFWESRAKEAGMSKAAISQTVEEVRQVLNLMKKFSKKRVA